MTDEPSTADLFARFIAARLGDPPPSDPPEAARADEPPPPIDFQAPTPDRLDAQGLEDAMRDYQIKEIS